MTSSNNKSLHLTSSHKTSLIVKYNTKIIVKYNSKIIVKYNNNISKIFKTVVIVIANK